MTETNEELVPVYNAHEHLLQESPTPVNLRNKRWEEGEDENERQRSGHDDFV